MARYNINKQTHIATRLLELRRHINGCGKCKGAIKSRDIHELCDSAILLILDVAGRWDANVAGRISSARKGRGVQFLCPDPNAHGPAYAVTAEAVEVVAIQDSLF